MHQHTQRRLVGAVSIGMIVLCCGFGGASLLGGSAEPPAERALPQPGGAPAAPIVRRTDGLPARELPVDAAGRPPNPADADVVALTVTGRLFGRDTGWCRFDTGGVPLGLAAMRETHAFVGGKRDATAMPRFTEDGTLVLLVEPAENGADVVVTHPDLGVLAIRFDGERCTSVTVLSEPVRASFSWPGAVKVRDVDTRREAVVDDDGGFTLAGSRWPVLAIAELADGGTERVYLAGPGEAPRAPTDAEVAALAEGYLATLEETRVITDTVLDAVTATGDVPEEEVEAIRDRLR